MQSLDYSICIERVLEHTYLERRDPGSILFGTAGSQVLMTFLVAIPAVSTTCFPTISRFATPVFVTTFRQRPMHFLEEIADLPLPL
jgi:hypothetical protein